MVSESLIEDGKGASDKPTKGFKMSTDEVKMMTNKSHHLAHPVRQQMKVVEAIVPDNWGLEKSFWSGEVGNLDFDLESKKSTKSTKSTELTKRPAFVVVFSDSPTSYAEVIEAARKSTSVTSVDTSENSEAKESTATNNADLVLNAANDGVRVITGIHELKIAAHTFAKDWITETRCWLICLPHLKKMKPTASSTSNCNSDIGLGLKIDNFCPSDYLTLEMRAATTSVMVFKDDVMKMDTWQTIPALYKLYGGNFPSIGGLKLFESTVWRILNFGGVAGIEIIPSRAVDELCIVRKICRSEKECGW